MCGGGREIRHWGQNSAILIWNHMNLLHLGGKTVENSFEIGLWVLGVSQDHHRPGLDGIFSTLSDMRFMTWVLYMGKYRTLLFFMALYQGAGGPVLIPWLGGQLEMVMWVQGAPMVLV